MTMLTIIICTYNRSEILKNALISLENQTIDSRDFDIIIIDNNSTDDTKYLVNDFVARNSNAKYFIEKQQGISYARNRGFFEANTEYVGYMDDDAIADINWVKTALNLIEEHKPDIFGGPIYPYYLSDKPEWFKDEYEIRLHQSNTGWMKKGSYISGSNVFFKRELLDLYGGFNPILGPKGESIGYGEDVEPIFRAQNEHRKIYYSLNLKVKHLVPDYKMDIGFYMYSSLKTAKALFDINTIHKSNYKPKVMDLIGQLNNIEKLLKIYNMKKRKENVNIENYYMENINNQLFNLSLLIYQIKSSLHHNFFYKIYIYIEKYKKSIKKMFSK